MEKLPGISAYFIGKDASKWRPEVPHYGRVEYEAVYPGVDVVYYGNKQQIEYDFKVAPGTRLGCAGDDLASSYSEGQGGRGTLDYLHIVSEPVQSTRGSSTAWPII